MSTQQPFAHYAAARARRRQNRRRHARAPLHVRAQVTQGARLVARTASDISETGMRIDTDEFAEHSKVRVFIPIPRPDRRRARLCLLEATVVWRANGVSGLRFDAPSPTSLHHVRDYVESVGRAAA